MPSSLIPRMQEWTVESLSVVGHELGYAIRSAILRAHIEGGVLAKKTSEALGSRFWLECLPPPELPRVAILGQGLWVRLRLVETHFKLNAVEYRERTINSNCCNLDDWMLERVKTTCLQIVEDQDFFSVHGELGHC